MCNSTKKITNDDTQVTNHKIQTDKNGQKRQ